MQNENTAISQQIIHALLLNASFIDNLGLLNGKMGIAIYFFHLAREIKNQIYEDFAGELIDEIYEEITLNTPLDFENGLAGIGWGIEYLVQNGFIDANTDEVLEEFDDRLFRELVYNTPQEIGLLNGLAGLGAYFLKRIQNPDSNDEKIATLTNKKTLIHLIDELDRRTIGVSSIIREPDTGSGGEKSLEPNSNPERKTCSFDLTWDYPALIGFLAEVFQLNLYNTTVNSILQRLIAPLLQTENLPKLQSNRLLLAYALTKLGQSEMQLKGQEEIGNITKSIENIELERIVENLLSGISSEIICQELTPNCAFLKNGTTGIAWTYQQLFSLTANHEFKTEADYWLRKSFMFEETDQGYAGFQVAKENENQAFGLLNGLAGIGLMDITIQQFDHLILKP